MHQKKENTKRSIIIGTQKSCEEVSRMLQTHAPAIHILGCLWLGQPHDQQTQTPLGQVQDAPQICKEKKINRIYLSLPLITIERYAKTISWIWQSGLEVVALPTASDQLAGRALQALRMMNKNDAQTTTPSNKNDNNSLGMDLSSLINRQPQPLDLEAIRQTIQDKRIMITGAGGSIGSQIARIVSSFNPEKIILIERSENALFEIDRKIKRIYPKIKRSALLHDVTHFPKTIAMVKDEKPHVIFHAAAHKHVPMMEDHPAAAVENNFYGTRSIAQAASQNNVEKFVMISTDKAVNPSSVMGATKRIAELYVQHLNAHSKTTYCMVRFGNVLGSACSVLPIWEDQIKNGYGVTVTDKNMTRFFMTIPEAAGLVLQSAAMSGKSHAQGGEIFLLDMGKPVRILDLAHRFVRSLGLEPNVDVPIHIVGPRPGEKLHEELAYEGEDMTSTTHPSIRLWRTQAPPPARIKQMLQIFDNLRNKGNTPGHDWQHANIKTIQAALHRAVPEMVSAIAG